MRWYRKVFQETDENKQLALIVNACVSYEDEYDAARNELKLEGRIERIASRLPGLATDNFTRLQDLENMLEHVQNIEDRTLMSKAMFYKEGYQRELSDRLAEKYANAHDDVQTIRSIRFRVSSVRNQFLAISKGLEYAHFQISNVTKLRCAGIEDSSL